MNKKIIILNDDVTPMDYVARLLTEVFGLEKEEAERIMLQTHNQGEGVCGEYDAKRADLLLNRAQAHIDSAGYPLQLKAKPANGALPDSANEEGLNPPAEKCSFCNKPKTSVEVLVAGPGVYICNACVDLALGVITEHRKDDHFKHTHELLAWHFGTQNNADIVTSSRLFPERVRADLQYAVNEIFGSAAKPVRFVGVHGNNQHESIKIPNLLEKGRYPKLVGPLQYEDVDIGEPEPVKCLENGLWLCEDSGVRYV